jgi:hypothetical protein
MKFSVSNGNIFVPLCEYYHTVTYKLFPKNNGHNFLAQPSQWSLLKKEARSESDLVNQLINYFHNQPLRGMDENCGAYLIR